VASLAGQRLLVTGGTGFIGARLCRRATERGATVVAVSRRPGPIADGVRWERADLNDLEATREVLRRHRPDAVLHLAGQVSGGRGRDLVLPMLQANLVATVNVMLASADSGTGVVLAGSMEEPDFEDPDAVAQSPYAAAKWAAHAYARHLHTLHALPVVHLRVFMVYGPGQHDPRKLVP
jgi:UDP-glucose 4-epimerase